MGRGGVEGWACYVIYPHSTLLTASTIEKYGLVQSKDPIDIALTLVITPTVKLMAGHCFNQLNPNKEYEICASEEAKVLFTLPDFSQSL